MLSGLSCAPVQTRLRIVDYRADAEPEEYVETFDECYYAAGAGGVVDIVARRRIPSEDPDMDAIEQTVHLRLIYNPDPGRTFVDSTMINATVEYAISSGDDGACFEGGAFVSAWETQDKKAMNARIESATLTPHRFIGDGQELFERATLQGKLHAKPDRQRTVRMMNDVDHRFGPRPRYLPPVNANWN
jgi:hypothetical protein